MTGKNIEISPLEQEIQNLNLPRGISLAKGFEKFSNIASIKQYIRNHTYEFRDRLIEEIRDIDADKVSLIDAASGSLLIHYLYLIGIKGDISLVHKTHNVFAIQIHGPKQSNGQGTKEHIFSAEEMEEIQILIDDILDTAGSSRDVQKRRGDHRFRMRTLSIKIGKLSNLLPRGNGRMKFHTFADEWIATCFGMNSGIGETKNTKNNPAIRARMHEISKLERTCCLPLAFNDELAADWGPQEVQQYIDILKTNSFFEDGEIPVELNAMYDDVIAFKDHAEVNNLSLEDQQFLAPELWQKLKAQEQLILKVEA